MTGPTCQPRARLVRSEEPDGYVAPFEHGHDTTCSFDLGRLMRLHKVTLRELARRTGATLKAIRAIRGQARVSYLTYCDYTEAVTGRCVFNLGRYEAIRRQSGKADR